MTAPATLTAQIESVFRRIHRERMREVPLLNPRLSVETVGFRACPVGWVGVLVTPWFINLLIIPNADTRRALDPAAAIGHKTLHTFPAGRFEFIVGREPELGPYEMCSLFSPVLEFPDQETARHAAQGALEALLTPPPPAAGASAPTEDPWSPHAVLSSGAALNVTRRGLLFGPLRRRVSGHGAP